MPSSTFDPHALIKRIAEVFSTRHGVGFAQIGPSLTIDGVSENFANLLQVDETQIKGHSLTEVFWEFVGAEDALKEVLTAKRPDFHLALINRPMDDGSTRYYNYSVIPLNEQQTEVGLLLLIEDTTLKGELEQNLTQDRNELRMAQAELYATNEELKRLDRLKSIFLAVAAHDLRAPLTAIYGNATLLRDDLGGTISEESRASLGTIISQAEWLNRLISNILDLDQIEQGKLILRTQAIDIKNLVLETTETLRETVKLFGLNLNLRLPPEPMMMTVDPDRIRQILYNLLSNAIKYTPSGGNIRVSVDQETEHVVIRVQDDGLGIPDYELGELFQLYFRTSGAKKSGRTGTGVGLFIVKTLVDAHHGEIDVASELGQGTTFTVRLRASQAGFSL